MDYESAIDEVTGEIKRKADMLDSAMFEDFSERCDELRVLINRAEQLAEQAIAAQRAAK